MNTNVLRSLLASFSFLVFTHAQADGWDLYLQDASGVNTSLNLSQLRSLSFKQSSKDKETTGYTYTNYMTANYDGVPSRTFVLNDYAYLLIDEGTTGVETIEQDEQQVPTSIYDNIVYDIAGRPVANLNETNISTLNLPKGIYILNNSKIEIR